MTLCKYTEYKQNGVNVAISLLVSLYEMELINWQVFKAYVLYLVTLVYVI